MTTQLAVLGDGSSRVRRDRLEILTALIDGPGFDPLFRPDLMKIPADHPVYGWGCIVDGCERIRRLQKKLCETHFLECQASGSSLMTFLKTARPLTTRDRFEPRPCAICPDRTVHNTNTGLCKSHDARWHLILNSTPQADLQDWINEQVPLPSYGTCSVHVCSRPAATALRLCRAHLDRYTADGKPGGARVPGGWWRKGDHAAPPAPTYIDAQAFRNWCRQTGEVHQFGSINLAALPPLLKAEIKWGLNTHAQMKHHSTWDIRDIQRMANRCAEINLTSLADFTSHAKQDEVSHLTTDSKLKMICLEIAVGLRIINHSPADSKEAGFIETEHFGRRFPHSGSYFDLTGVPQVWLRDLLWDHLAELLRSAKCPRTRGHFDSARRAMLELGGFLALDAPRGGHDPSLLGAEHAQRWAADLLNRARHGMPSLGTIRSDGQPSTVTSTTQGLTFTYARKVLFQALNTGRSDLAGLDRAFITALPQAGAIASTTRHPFNDETARALADETNLQAFADTFDPHDRGLRDAWETIVATGRRCSEVLKLRLDCTGRYRGHPMLWHDQTKVGNYNEGIRIPEYLYTRIAERRAKTLTAFEDKHGRAPAIEERKTLALFPSEYRNPRGDKSISYGHFHACFKEWVTSLDLADSVIHQARHTLATKLLAAGASLAHIRRYLGQVSDRMAEHYAKVAHSDLDDILATVWVAGPASVDPGAPLACSIEPLSREEATALAIDLSKRSTPVEGGICTHQVVVNGGACPWKLDCHNCDKFVLSGADLLYWRRKAEQWRSLAERAPTDEMADWLHKVFEPTARAIEGLEKALAAMGLLDQALALDLRRPQDYYQRIWAINFRATDLAEVAEAAHERAFAEDGS
ncbi:tyrosine-type recombinase/integrase [Streptosporangium vulgare]|uniref:Tyrosine-type recombinase/integrase n=1 Tax=Streptosporangium vulgare TaxID=46190 RepID=A0ABV5TGT7_9ACTN